jgi:TfoX/Sxy family transcriptional regulator of competence genes
MPYDESLARRVRAHFARRRTIVEKKMFGGVGLLHRGNLCVAVWQDALIARVGPDAYLQALDEPMTKKFDITGRAMKGWVMVLGDGVADDDDLRGWIERATRFVESLPPK